MSSIKNLMCGLLLVGAGFGAATVIEMKSTRDAFGQPPVVGEDNWRYHDGRWSYWSAPDKRWYYTDGQHWFYNEGKSWAPYRFDNGFGRKFERSTYVAPAAGVSVTVPTHRVYVGP